MNSADPGGARAVDGRGPTSFSILPSAVQLLATQNATETSGSTLESNKDEARTEYDQLSLYSPFDQTWSDPLSTDPDRDENSRSSRRYSNLTSSTSLISRLQSFATSSTSANSLYTNHTAWCSTAAAPTSRSCSVCHRRISGQFVRALGTVFHFDCFRCADCNIGIASGFFPLQGSDGKLQPLCERDHFRRLDLTCAKCKQALKGSYIAACNKKFHVEHFTCSVCSELLKPQGAWGGNGDVYCRQHYLIWSATKCTGCWTFVENPFVETGLVDGPGKRWHRECYLLNKFWDVRLAKSALQGPLLSEPEGYTLEKVHHGVTPANNGQINAEALAHLIWTRLSEYEESSLACLSNISRYVNNYIYLGAIQVAARLVLQIEVLFAAIDDLEKAGAESLSQTNYAENLFHTTFDLIKALSGARDDSPVSNSVQLDIQRERTVQALLGLTPSLASHHKNLIIITLNGALKLKPENPYGNPLLKLLDRLQRLAMVSSDPNADRQEYFAPVTITNVNSFSSEGIRSLYPRVSKPYPLIAVEYSEGVTYGYQSLSPEYASKSLPSPGFTPREGKDDIVRVSALPSDGCKSCLLPINEGCVRLGIYQRWHFHCFVCVTCQKLTEEKIDAREGSVDENLSTTEASPEVSGGQPPTNLNDFRYGFFTTPRSLFEKPRIYCTVHANAGWWHGSGFEVVSRLEQYAFVLNVAIRRSHFMLFGDTYATTEVFPWSGSSLSLRIQGNKILHLGEVFP